MIPDKHCWEELGLRDKRVIGSVVVLALIAFGGLWIYRGWRPISQDISMYRGQTIGVTRDSIVQVVDAAGEVEAVRHAIIGFTAPGQVESIYAEQGQRVERGQLLASIESTQEELGLLRAQTALETARINGVPAVVREREYDLQLAQLQYERTLIRAPFSGTIADLRVEPGEFVSTGTPLVQILDLSRFYVRVFVDELDIQKIAEGQRVEVDIPAAPEGVFRGTVIDVDAVAHSSGGIVSVPVLIELDHDAEVLLRPGYSASARIEVERMDDVFVIPLEAVVRTEGQALASVIRHGEERIVDLRLGISDGQSVAVIEGLEEEDQLRPFNYELFQALIGSQRSPWDPGLPAGFPGAGR